MFDHLDRGSKDGKVYLDEFNTSIQSLRMIDVPIRLSGSDFRKMKDKSKGYFDKQQFVDYCWRTGLTTLTERPKEMEDIV